MKWKIGLVVVGLSVAGAGLGAQAPAETPQVPVPTTQGKRVILERILVRVNGEILTQSELLQRQTDELRSRNMDPTNLTDAAVLKLLNDMTPTLLVESINEMLLEQRGHEMGITFSEKAFQEGIENIKKENKLDDAGLKQVMAQQGITMEQLRKNFERIYMIQQVQQEEVFGRMHVTEEELRQYYAAHKGEFTTPETVTLRELYVAAAPDGSEVTPAQTAAAREKVSALRTRATSGEDFVELVKAESEAASKTNGGLIGPVNIQDINPTVRDLVASLKTGEISEPIEMPRGGFEIFKMESRQTPEVQPFDKVKPQIEQKIRESRLDTETDKLLDRLRGQAVIEWKDSAYKQLYEQALAQQVAAR